MTHEANVQKLRGIFQEIYSSSISSGVVLEKYAHMMNAFLDKKRLPTDKYLEQLEKNVPYNKFLYLFTLSELLDYIFSLTKSSNTADQSYMQLLEKAQKNASSNAQAVISYLQSNQDNPSMTDDFKHLKKLKKDQKYTELFDELEFQIQYYKAHYEMVCYTTMIILNNPNISQFIASSFHKGDAMEEFRTFLRQAINYLLTNASPK